MGGNNVVLIHLPLKAPATKFFSQLHSLRYIPRLHRIVARLNFLEMHLVIVEPNLCQPNGVMKRRVATKSVRAPSAEYVPDPGTGSNHHLSAAHPCTEGQLQIFTTPFLHFLVVAAHLKEIFTVDCKQPA